MLEEADPLLWKLLLQFFLIFLNAVFACAEIAVISINDNKLEKLSNAGNRQAQRLLSLTAQPAKFLATIQVGITLAGFLGSAFAADNFSDHVVKFLLERGVRIDPALLDTLAVIVITLILAFFTLVFGELVPKRIAMRHAERIGLSMSGLVYFVAKLFAPIVWLLTAATNAVLRLLGIDPNANDSIVTEEEIRMLVDAGSLKGAIDEEEKQFIHNVFEFDNKTVDELMTHRTEVAVLWLDQSDAEWEDVINNSRYSMYPICGDSTDDVKGLLSTKDYFRMKDRSREHVMAQAVRPIWFVPESIRADVLFQNMKKSRNHFAVVLDEYGGMSGIVTIGDLIEELLGDLDDEEIITVESTLIKALDDNKWLVRGSAQLDDVSHHLGVELSSDDYNTFAGMVFSWLGNIPQDGSTPCIQAQGLEIQIDEIKDHRLKRATVRRIQAADEVLDKSGPFE